MEISVYGINTVNKALYFEIISYHLIYFNIIIIRMDEEFPHNPENEVKPEDSAYFNVSFNEGKIS